MTSLFGLHLKRRATRFTNPEGLDLIGTYPLAQVGVTYSFTPSVVGGTGPYTFSYLGTLPAGLSFNESTGAVTGTPSTAGRQVITIILTDANNVSIMRVVWLTVVVNNALNLTGAVPAGRQNVAFAGFTPTRNGGTGPFTYSISAGSLPSGLSLNTSTGAITGTFTGYGTPSCTLRVQDSTSTVATLALNFNITRALALSGSAPNGVQNSAYAGFTPTRVGGAGTITYTITSGTLYSGLTLNSSTGAITGTSTQYGTNNVTITATDSDLYTATLNVSIVITQEGAEPVAAPSNTVAPAASGATIVGDTATTTNGTWTGSPTLYTYQWQRNAGSWVNVPGATSSTLVLTDWGTYRCQVTASNAGGPTIAYSNTFMVSASNTTSNPVTTAKTGSVATYNVNSNADLDAIPWGSLAAGTVVNIYYNGGTPYQRKWGMRSHGESATPIEVWGVTDASGNRPRLNFAGAITCPGSNPGGNNNVFGTTPAFGESLGGIVIKRGVNDAYTSRKPSYIKISNLELYGAENGASYTTMAGGTVAYNASAGIYAHKAEDLYVENCVIRNNGFGFFSQAHNDELSQACERINIRNCRIYNNGIVGSFLEHNLYMQCKQPICEGNYVGQLRPGAQGSAYKSRSSGEIFRYNYVEAHARALDFVHSEDQGVDGILRQPEYGVDYCYGNVIVNDSQLPNGAAMVPVHFGGDNMGEDENTHNPTLVPLYRTRLFFFGNTYYIRPSNSDWRSIIFDLSLQTTTVDAWDNVFIVDLSGNVNTQVSWVEYAGNLNLRGNNLLYTNGNVLPARADATAGMYNVQQLGTLLTGDPRAYDATNGDYRPSASSAARPVSLGVPSGVPSGLNVFYPLSWEIQGPQLNGLVTRTDTETLGALSYANVSQASATLSTPPPALAAPVNTVLPTLSATPEEGVEVTCSSGTWTGNPTPTYAYAWFLDDVQVGNVAAYTPPADSAGSALYCRVTASNSQGSVAVNSATVEIQAEGDGGGPVDPPTGWAKFGFHSTANGALSNSDQTWTRTTTGTANTLANIPLFEDCYFEFNVGGIENCAPAFYAGTQTTLPADRSLGNWWGEPGVIVFFQPWRTQLYGFAGLVGAMEGTDIMVNDNAATAPINLQCAYVHATRSLWFRIRHGSVTSAWLGGGNPTAGTSPSIVMPGANPVYVGAGSDGGAVTLLLPANFLGTEPAGFTRGIGSDPP